MVSTATQAVEKAYDMAREDIYTFIVVVFITITVAVTFTFYKVISKFAQRWFAEKDAYEQTQNAKNDAYYKEQQETSKKVVQQFETTINKIFHYLEREQTRNDNLYDTIREDRAATDVAIKVLSEKFDNMAVMQAKQNDKIDTLSTNVMRLHDRLDSVQKSSERR